MSIDRRVRLAHLCLRVSLLEIDRRPRSLGLIDSSVETFFCCRLQVELINKRSVNNRYRRNYKNTSYVTFVTPVSTYLRVSQMSMRLSLNPKIYA